MESSFYNYLIDNKEWIFSGIGVLVISILVSIFQSSLISQKEYTVCKHVKTGEYKAFKEGWSWSAFFFSFLWLIWKGLYEIPVLYIIFILCLGIHFSYIDSTFDTNISQWFFSRAVGLTVLFAPFIIGKFGNFLFMYKYTDPIKIATNNHFDKKRTVLATSEDGAIAIYINNFEKPPV